MRAIVVSASGSADELQLHNREVATPGSGQVLVRVRACGVCHRDIIERRGGFPMIRRPVVPGHEFAGEVVSLGPNVDAAQLGTRVVNLHRAPCGTCDMCSAGHEPRCRRAPHLYGLSVDGGYAEFVVADARSLVELPPAVSYEHGCFLNCTAAVALRALRTVAQVVPEEHVVVVGATGGVGMHAVQIARALGARVTAITSNPAKAEALRDVGVEDVVIGEPGTFHQPIARRNGGRGVDVVLDCVGAPTLNASLRCLDRRGRLVVVGNVTADRVDFNAGYIILNELRILGSAGASRSDLEQVLAWASGSVIRPIVAEVIDLAEAAAAHRRLEARGVCGRIVLRP